MQWNHWTTRSPTPIRGKAKRLGRADIGPDGRWSFRVPSPRLDVYASYAKHRRQDIAVCRSARSKLARR